MLELRGANTASQNVETGRKIVLAGNPNAGKSVLFHALTGVYVEVSNYPGTTLEITRAKFGDDVLVDTPGVYGIGSFNDEEAVARDIILSADTVINIVNAGHLERDLFLTQQIIDTGVPVIVALNMVDEAQTCGLVVDADLISRRLRVPVVPMVAIKGTGVRELRAALQTAATGISLPEIADRINRLQGQCPGLNRGEALLVLEGDVVVAARHGLDVGNGREEIYLQRRRFVNALVDEAVRQISGGSGWAGRLSTLMLQPVTGIPLLLAALWLAYEAIGVFVAQNVVGFTENTMMLGHYQPFVREIASAALPPGSPLWSLLVGDFGLLTMPAVYLVGLLLPLVAGFYFFLSLFEDSGYLPRIAALADRVLTGIGLNGRAVIPIILGFGCVTVATIVTRLLGSEREKTIAIFLLGLTIPCSAQLGVIAAMLAGLGYPYIVAYALAIFSVLAVVGTLMHALLPGESSDLLIDIPPLRIPRAANVVKKTAGKSFAFLAEAAPLFVFGALLISVFQITGLLTLFQELIAPLTVGWLHLPREAASAFIMGIFRRDFGAAGLTALSLTETQTLVALITMTLFVPCIASVLIIFKERTRKEAAMMWFGSMFIAFLVGGVVAALGQAPGITGVLSIIGFFCFLTGAALLFAHLRGRNRARQAAFISGGCRS